MTIQRPPQEMPERRRIDEIIEGGDYDVLFCQPPLLMQIPYSKQERAVIEYYNNDAESEGLLGDDPYEQNNGILEIAASLQAAGLRVGYLDFHGIDLWHRKNADEAPISEGEIFEILLRFTYKVFAVSAMTVSAPRALHLAKMSREHIPEAHILAGGVFPYSSPRYFQNVATVLREDQDPVEYILSHFSIYLRRKRGFRAYNLVAADFPIIPRFITDHGCRGECAFCSLMNSPVKKSEKATRERKALLVIENLRRLVSAYHVRFFALGNPSFLSNPNADRPFLRLLREDASLPPYWCQCRLDALNEELIEELALSRCAQIAVGIETPSVERLAAHHKRYGVTGTTEECAVRTLSALKEAGISTYAYFMLGIPGETEADVQSTISLIEELVASALLDATHISTPVAYPGTGWYSNPDKYGFRITHHDYGQYWMNCDPLGYGLPVIDTPSLSAETLYSLWLESLERVTEARRQSKKSLGKHNSGRRFNLISTHRARETA